MEKLGLASTGLRKAAVWLIVSILVVLAALVGTSRFLESSDPDLALAFFPLNSEGIAQKAARRLVEQQDEGALLDLRRDIQAAIQYDRLDARLVSLLGEITSRLSGPESARPYFDHAFRLSKTELLTLNQKIVQSAYDNQPVEALRYLDIVLRRWPDRFDQVAAIIPALLNTPEGYAAVLANLANEPPWRSGVITRLARQPETTPLAGRLLLDLQATASPPRSPELAASIGAYIRQQNYEDAYRLFLFTLSDEERKRNGYVFNGDFRHATTRRPFDWQSQAQSGVEIIMPSDRGGRADGAVVRFLEKPVKTISLSQYLHLPTGDYRLSLDASARSLSLPKELFWSLKCARPNRDIARMNIPEGSFTQSRIDQDFQIDAAACPIQILRLETGLVAESWRHRYSGMLTMHKMQIERVQP